MSTTAIAETHPQQHLIALAQANAVRLARAGLKRRIADGSVSAVEVFVGCPWEAASMSVADVLQSQRRWGSERCRRFLRAVQISETRTVGALTSRQREQIAGALAG